MRRAVQIVLLGFGFIAAYGLIFGIKAYDYLDREA